MKKLISIIALLASVAMTFTACSSNKSSDNYNYTTTTAAASNYESYDGAYNEAKSLIDINEYLNTSSINSANEIKIESEFESKIIRNARLSMESLDVIKTYNDFLTYVKDNGGYEFSMDMSSNEHFTSISATIKIKPSKLDGAVAYASECGKVLSSNVSSEDITSQYYDTKIRLDNKYKNLDKYYEYLENAHKMEEIIQLQNQIDYLTADIEAFEGQLRMWDTLTSESTIILNISQKNDPNAYVEEEVEEFNWRTMTFSKMFRHMSNGFKKTCNVIFSVLQWLVITLTTLFPMLVIAGIITFFVVRHSKKKKAAINEKITSQNNSEEETPSTNDENSSDTDTK